MRTRDPVGPARIPRLAPGALLAALLVGAAGFSAARAAYEAESKGRVRGVESEVLVSGMSLVVSREDDGDLLLDARQATLHPETNTAELRDATLRVLRPDRSLAFDVAFVRGELDLASNDFLAEGEVHGRTGDGQRYAAPWIRYERAQGLLHTEAPVSLEEPGGSVRGDGFRYHLRERRFELLGNVRVEHTP